MTPRAIAAGVLDRVVRGGAYSNIVVRTATAGMADRDARFVQRLLFGALRHLLRIDRALTAVATRPLSGLDPAVLASLRIGAEELLFLGSPAHAAVNGAVDAVREQGAPAAAGFVNAVLRAVARSGEPPLPSGDAGAAMQLGVPPWLFAQVMAAIGRTGAEEFLAAADTEPAIGIRSRGAAPVPGSPVPGIPGAHLSDDAVAVGASVAAGHGWVADPSSVAVGLAVAAGPGMTVADLAAAPGNKTAHLWDAMEHTGTVVAGDRHERRARAAARRIDPRILWIIADSTRPPLRPGAFDRVLLDAPCTGLGTLRRRPEIRHRLHPSSAAAAGRRQRAMVEAALALVRPGGRLVYSVCTLLVEETIDVVAGLGAHRPEGLPGMALGDGILMAPHLTGTDGMFIAVIDP